MEARVLGGLLVIILFSCLPTSENPKAKNNVLEKPEKKQGIECLTSLELIGQKKQLWCWAASIEMITRCYGLDLTQLDIAHETFVSQFANAKRSCPCFGGSANSICENLCDPGSVGCKQCCYNHTISSDHAKKEFERLFDSLGFHSTQFSGPGAFTWEDVRNEISQSRPFLLNLNKIDIGGGGRSFEHVVCVKNAVNLEKEENRFLLAYDPQEASLSCNGCRILLPYSVFEGDQNALNSIKTVVRGIHPQEARCISMPNLDANSDDSSFVEGAKDVMNLFSFSNGHYANFDELDSLVSSPSDIVTVIYKHSSQLSVEREAYLARLGSNLLYMDMVEDDPKVLELRAITQHRCSDFGLEKLHHAVEEAISQGELTGSIIDYRLGYYVFIPSNTKFYFAQRGANVWVSPLIEYSLSSAKGNEYILQENSWIPIDSARMIVNFINH